MTESFEDLKRQIHDNRERERYLLWRVRGLAVDDYYEDRGPTERELFLRVTQKVKP